MRKKDWFITLAIGFLLACGLFFFQQHTEQWINSFRDDLLGYALIAIALLLGVGTAFVPVRSDGPAAMFAVALAVGFVLSYYGILYSTMLYVFAGLFGMHVTRWLSLRLKNRE